MRLQQAGTEREHLGLGRRHLGLLDVDVEVRLLLLTWSGACCTAMIVRPSTLTVRQSSQSGSSPTSPSNTAAQNAASATWSAASSAT
jgi:hypothetical protein